MITQVCAVSIMYFNLKIGDPKLIFKIHKTNGLFLLGLALIHLMLNWGWIAANFRKKNM